MKISGWLRANASSSALDNVFVERLWRSVKYEEVYLKDYATGVECHAGLKAYLEFYCEERPHQSLDYRTPAEVYRAGAGARLGRETEESSPRPSVMPA